MEKNWLIRTRSNHILGPISKEKVVELYQNGSIKPDDEVCSGNGYWFFIREEDMVARFLTGNEVQGFNPISEAKDILTATGEVKPDAPREDITLVSGLNVSKLKESPPIVQEPQKKSESPLDDSAPAESKKKNRSEVSSPKTSVPKQKAVLKKQSYLQYLTVLGLVLLFLVVYYRKLIMTYFFQGEVTNVSISLLSSAHAQEDVPGKKKSF